MSKQLWCGVVLLAIGCGPTVNIVESTPDTGVVGADGAVDATPESSSPGDLGAPCKADGDCLSKLCLDVGRCSKACNAAGICPNSANWKCLVLPLRGPMCECELLSKTEVPCNGVDDNCDGVIDEGSPTCAGKCVDVSTDLNNCGGCGLVCGGGTTCTGGKCVCPPEKSSICGMKCVDSKTDVANCGACGKACAAGESCMAGACKKSTGVDVNILLGVTGSTTTSLTSAAKIALKDKLATPLLAIADVQAGVSYTCDFPISPYGTAPDTAFTGGIEPTATLASVFAAIDKATPAGGGDGADGMIEALGVLSGTTPHPTSIPLTCSAGRVSGGCWRADAKKVIVLFTDDVFHNGPNPTTTGLYETYVGFTTAPVDWPAVLKAMLDAKVTLLIINTAGSVSTDALGQQKKMMKDLGQPETDIFIAGASSETIGTAVDGVVARIKAIKTGL